MKATIVRTDGTEEEHEISKATAFAVIGKLIGAECLGTVNLKDGRVMINDDLAYETRDEERPAKQGEFYGIREGALVIEKVCVRPLKPFNDKATKMYHAVCIPGTTHQIAGDVAIVWDRDFE